MKKLLLLSTIFLMKFASAQFYSGYGGFSLAEFFDRIDPQTIILVLLFLVFFALIFYALSRIFKDPHGRPNKGIAGIIAFAISAMITYGLYRTGFDFGGIFYNLGFSSDLLYPILAAVSLIIVGLLIWKLKVSRFLMTFGLFIILLTIFTEIFYEKGFPLIIGIVSLVIGFLLWRGRRRRLRSGGGSGGAGSGGGSTRRRRFGYSQGMKRGGLKSKKSRYVSKRAVERYARRFGPEAAKKRFG